MQNISFRIDPTVSIMVSVLKQINMTLFVVGIIIWHYQDPMMIPEAWEKESRGAIDCSLTFQGGEIPSGPLLLFSKVSQNDSQSTQT